MSGGGGGAVAGRSGQVGKRDRPRPADDERAAFGARVSVWLVGTGARGRCTRLVVCHGDACAPNTLLDGDGRVVGHVDLGALGLADRWADLAVASWSTCWNYGDGWEQQLLSAYGVEPDPSRLAYYRLLWDLDPASLSGRGIVRRMGDRDETPTARFDTLEPEQVAAFRAFRRPRTAADEALGADPAAVSRLDRHLNPELSRRVYAGVEGTIDLVPGPNAVCCVVTVAGTSERISGTTSTELAARGAHGFISTRGGQSATYRGVLATVVRDLQVVTAASETITVPVDADDAYWINFTEPVEQILILNDGTRRRLPSFSRPDQRPRGQS